MIFLRWSALVAMVLAIAGCVSGGGYSQYPDQGDYDDGSYYLGPSYPYYGSG